MQVKKFVVLSAARSGTSLLTETLNTHPQIVCHGEIFHPEPEHHLKGTLAALSFEDVIAMRKSLSSYVNSVFDQRDCTTVGFKMWLDQNPAWCNTFLADESCFKIIYERPNKLAQFSSNQLADVTNIWDLAVDEPGNPPELRQLDFHSDFFHEFIEFQERTFAHYRRRARGPILNLDYRQIASGDFSTVFEFLGVDDIPLVLQKRQIYTKNIVERFKEEQHQKVREHLRVVGHDEWVEER